MLKPVFIVVNILQGNSLWADESATERIVFVATNGELLADSGRDLETADRFAKIATAIMRETIACAHDASNPSIEPFEGSPKLSISDLSADITFLLKRQGGH